MARAQYFGPARAAPPARVSIYATAYPVFPKSTSPLRVASDALKVPRVYFIPYKVVDSSQRRVLSSHIRLAHGLITV